MEKDIQNILISKNEIDERLEEMAQNILKHYQGEDFLVVLILKGALVFTADLLRRMPVPLEIETINIASYHGGTSSTNKLEFLDKNLPNVEGRNVLIIDDILDTGRTLAEISKIFKECGAKSTRTAVLLTKNRQREVPFTANHTGFSIEDQFVVGYGLDYKGKYRNLPYVGILRPSAI